MQAIKDKRWQVVAAALGLLGLGFLAGALSMNLYHRQGSTNQRTRFEQALKQLNLSGDQQGKVDAILADTRNQLRDVRKEESPRVSDIRKQARERLQSVLTPEQWHQLQEKMKGGRENRPGERSSLSQAAIEE
jgi:Spy/CpxP family protein refolding chaperone